MSSEQKQVIVALAAGSFLMALDFLLKGLLPSAVNWLMVVAR